MLRQEKKGKEKKMKHTEFEILQFVNGIPNTLYNSLVHLLSVLIYDYHSHKMPDYCYTV